MNFIFCFYTDNEFYCVQGLDMMKKTGLLIVLPMLLTACSNTEDMTLDRLIFGHEIKPKDTTLSEMLFGKDCKSCNKKGKSHTDEEYVEYTEDGVTYRIASRGSRYMLNEPAPEVYAIAATRAINRFLDETGTFYEDNAESFIYIANLKKADRQLPDGVYNAERTVKKTIENSRTYKVVNDLEEADYILEPVIDNAGTPEEPILVFKLVLFDTDNNKIGQWTESLRRVQNDDGSWW